MNKVVIIVGVLLFVVLGALLPFVRQPEVTEEDVYKRQGYNRYIINIQIEVSKK